MTTCTAPLTNPLPLQCSLNYAILIWDVWLKHYGDATLKVLFIVRI